MLIENTIQKHLELLLYFITMDTPESTPGAETPPPPDRVTLGISPSSPRCSNASPNISAKSLGRKKIKRDRPKLFRENLKVKKVSFIVSISGDFDWISVRGYFF